MEITKVVFRKFKDGQILALFPEDFEHDFLIGSYMRIGQHGSADYSHCIRITKPANEEEYKPLFEELESIGYNLSVRKKMRPIFRRNYCA